MNELSRTFLKLALEEDLGAGDVTSLATIPQDSIGVAAILCKEDMVICGWQCAKFLCESMNLEFRESKGEGSLAEAGEFVAEVKGSIAKILSVERTLLNVVQRLSGIASKAAELVDLVKGSGVVLLDTRKTTPGMRELEKHAVALGGAQNHRFGLFDAFLIKNNHVDANAGDVGLTVKLCRESRPDLPLEVEVRDRAELESALKAKPDIILLDNMSVEEVRTCVQVLKGSSILTEASGGITEENIRDYAFTGVDRISLGMLTHSIKAKDISLRLKC